MGLDSNIQQKAQYWASSTVFDESTRKEISELLEKKDVKELTERFYKDLEFGTGGMRGILGAGTSRMNIYNVRKASMAFAQYLVEIFKDQPIKVAITYDSRHFSHEFAKASAEVFAAYNIHTYITSKLRPTPMLSFMVRYFKCHGGVCVTASHNPPAYNGYKVYWQTGGQVVPPHDEEIIKRYLNITDYASIKFIDYDIAKAKNLITEVLEELDNAYLQKVKALSIRSEGRENFKIIFTPLHGTSYEPMIKALDLFGFKNVWVVEEQKDPNGDFPTVKYPNPEEHEALNLAVNLAKKIEADLVLATDPDGDRIGIVYKDNDSYVFLNGNQIGALLIEYILSSLNEQNKLPSNGLVIKTIVTSNLQNKIAEHYGVYCDETLTGFKWICQLIEDYETGKIKPYRKYICGGEESYGFLMDSFVRDKDAISACCIAAEMAAYYKTQNLTLGDVLNQIFKRHGVYQEALYTLTLPGKEGANTIKKIMNKLRQMPPREIDNNRVMIIRDIKELKEYKFEGIGFKFSRDITLPISDVLQFILEDETCISVRPSGTEPKIKFYFSVREPVINTISMPELEKLKIKCLNKIENIKQAFIRLINSDSL